MSENSSPSLPKTKDSSAQLSTEAIARRHMLLKSLSKGSAVVAVAAVPIQTLATNTSLLTPGVAGGTAGMRCSVSGMQSGVHSKETTTAVTCGGYSPGWWGQVQIGSNPRAPRRSWSPAIPTALCTGTFTKTGTDDPGVSFANKTLFNVMDESGFANTKTRHWIGAWLNGLTGGPTGFPFPYTGPEILSLYNSSDPIKRANAYKLITVYLEVHS